MKRNISLFGFKFELSPVIAVGVAAVQVDVCKFGIPVATRTVSTKEVAEIIEAFKEVAEIADQAEALRGRA